MNDWFMYEEEGNIAVEAMMQEVKKALRDRPLPKVRQLLHQKIDEVAQNYAEVYDTDVRCNIAFRLARWASSVHELEIWSSYWDL